MVLIKLGILLTLILVLLRFKVPFTIAILATALFLGLWFNLGFKAIGNSALDTLQKKDTLSLAGIIAAILILTELLQSSGQLKRLSDSIIDLFGMHRFTYTLIPALVGLLPMPGGALFSAPTLDSVSDEEIPAHKKTMINYWFRHIWEYAWKLYPGFVLAGALAKVSLNTLTLYLLPFTFISIIAGAFIIFTGIKIKKTDKPKETKTDLSAIIRKSLKMTYLLSPIAIIVVLFIVKPGWHMLIDIAISLVWIILTALISKKLKPLAIVKILFTKLHIYQMMLIVVSVFVFTDVLKASTATADLLAFFNGGDAGTQISFTYLMISAICLPFITGALTGMTIAFVGITFPLIFAIIGPNVNIFPWAMLAYVSGLSGVMLSPLHLCLVLTTAYYGTTLMKVYKSLIPIVAMVLASAIIIFSALIFFNLT